MESKNVHILAVAMEHELIENIFVSRPNWIITKLNNASEFENHLDLLEAKNYCLALCGGTVSDEFSLEFAQVLKQVQPHLTSYYVTNKKENYQPSNYKKNGFADSYLLPMDMANLQADIIDTVSKHASTEKIYKSIFITDVDPKSVAPFATYVHLPLNNKYVRFSAANQPLGEEKHKRLTQKDFSKIHIDKADTKAFYKYSAQLLKGDEKMSLTEKSEKVASTIRTLFSGLLDQSKAVSYEDGKEFLSDCQKIVSNYITNGKTDNFYSKIQSNLGNRINSYDHAATVSTVASLFAIGTQLANPIDLAIAGFFHDIGRSDIENELTLLPLSEWPENKKETYTKHPLASVNMLKEKKVIISQEIEKAILQHHERFDGKGFPKQLSGTRISSEAQLLSLADQVCYLTDAADGRARMTLKEAFAVTKKNGSISPEILFKVQNLLAI